MAGTVCFRLGLALVVAVPLVQIPATAVVGSVLMIIGVIFTALGR